MKTTSTQRTIDVIAGALRLVRSCTRWLDELDLPPRLVPIVSLDHAQPLTNADLPGAPHTRRADRRGVARPSVVSAACSRSRCAA